jgi:hypothetical protein
MTVWLIDLGSVGIDLRAENGERFTGPDTGAHHEQRQVGKVPPGGLLISPKLVQPGDPLGRCERTRDRSRLNLDALDFANRIELRSSIPDHKTHDTGDDTSTRSCHPCTDIGLDLADELVHNGRGDL